MLAPLGRYRPRFWTFAFIFAVNAVLLGAYLWSRGGQVTTVHIEVRGSEFVVAVDGRERLRAEMPAPSTGGIRVYSVNPRVDPPTLPTAGRIESLRVTSLETDELLYESDAIADPPPALDGRDGPVLDLHDRPWRDYAVDIRYRNMIEGDVDLRIDGERKVTFRARRFSAPEVRLVSSHPEQATDEQVGVSVAHMEPSRTESAKAATAAVLRAYPVTVAVVAVAVVATIVFMRLAPSSVAPQGPHVPQRTALVLAITAAGCTTALAVFLLRFRMDGLVYVADEASYVFQARLLASGRTHMEPPAVPNAFAFAYTPFVIDNDGRWASFYPFGHPLALSFGAFVGAPWLVPPLLAGVNVLLMYAIGRLMYGAWTGVLAAGLMATSPFILMQASSYMSHTTAITYLLTCLLACLLSWRRPVFAGVIGGVAFGLLFNTRPLTAVMLLPAFVALIGVRWLAREHRVSQTVFLGAFSCAAMVLFGAYLGYNWTITGDPLDSGYAASGDLSSAFGFEGGHSVADGISNQVTNIMALLVVLNGWPAWIGLAFVFMPFVLGTRTFYDWLLLCAAASVIAGAALFFTTGFFYGPRYVVEAVPLLLLLSARGVTLLAQTPRRIARISGSGESAHAAPTYWFRLVIGAGAASLIVASAANWLLPNTSRAVVYATPESARAMRGHRLHDDRLSLEANRQDIHDALIIVDECDFNRRCYLSVFLSNDVDLNGDIVWAYGVGDDDARLLAEYPCRSLFYADYASSTITSAGTTGPSPGEQCS